MIFHCDNPTCSSTVEVVEIGALFDATNEQWAEIFAAMGWQMTHDSVRSGVICPRCIRDLAYA